MFSIFISIYLIFLSAFSSLTLSLTLFDANANAQNRMAGAGNTGSYQGGGPSGVYDVGAGGYAAAYSSSAGDPYGASQDSFYPANNAQYEESPGEPVMKSLF